jgi:hypothetical protein
VQFFGRAEINTGTDSATRCDVYATSASLATPVQLMIGLNNADDVFVDSFNTLALVRPVGPGQHTFTVGYQRLTGSTPCSFRNRTMMVAAFPG